MADAVTTQVLNDGPRNLVIKCTSISDGTGETAVVKADASAYGVDRFSIERVEYDVQGFTDVRLYFDASTDLPAVLMQGQGYKDFHGSNLPDPKGSAYTGDILVTSTGATAGDTYDITIWLKKKAA